MHSQWKDTFDILKRIINFGPMIMKIPWATDDVEVYLTITAEVEFQPGVYYITTNATNAKVDYTIINCAHLGIANVPLCGGVFPKFVGMERYENWHDLKKRCETCVEVYDKFYELFDAGFDFNRIFRKNVVAFM